MKKTGEKSVFLFDTFISYEYFCFEKTKEHITCVCVCVCVCVCAGLSMCLYIYVFIYM